MLVAIGIKEVVYAEKVNQNAKVEGTGKVALKEGNNTVKVTVTAEAGNTKTYTLTIKRKTTEEETAENGEIALEMLKISNHNYYDLVLMDVMMPVMDGYQATKEIRKLEDKKISNIPIIAMTANAFEDDRQNAINAGMNDYISKPIKVETVYSVIKKYL